MATTFTPSRCPTCNGSRSIFRSRSACNRRLTCLAICSRRAQQSFTRAVIEKPPGEESGKSGGSGVLDRPEIDLSTGELTLKTEGGLGAIDIGGQKGTGGGDYRVLLLDSEKHTEPHIVQVVPKVVQGVSEDQARNAFVTSKQLGQAMITSCLKEHAEFYVEQLMRQQVKSSMEPDTTTM